MLPGLPPRDAQPWGRTEGSFTPPFPLVPFCSHRWPSLALSSGILPPELAHCSSGGRGGRALFPSANPPKEMQESSPHAWECWLWFPAGETEAGSEAKPSLAQEFLGIALPENLLPGLGVGTATQSSETQRSHIPVACASSLGTLRCSAPPGKDQAVPHRPAQCWPKPLHGPQPPSGWTLRNCWFLPTDCNPSRPDIATEPASI